MSSQGIHLEAISHFKIHCIFISWPRKIKKRMERSLSICSSFSFNRLNDCVDEAVIMMPTSNFRMPSLTDPQDSPAERKSSSAGSSASRTEREFPEALVGQQMPILGGQEKMWHVCRSSWDFRFLLGLSIVDMPELGCDSATGHQIKKKKCTGHNCCCSSYLIWMRTNWNFHWNVNCDD